MKILDKITNSKIFNKTKLGMLTAGTAGMLLMSCGDNKVKNSDIKIALEKPTPENTVGASPQSIENITRIFGGTVPNINELIEDEQKIPIVIHRKDITTPSGSTNKSGREGSNIYPHDQGDFLNQLSGIIENKINITTGEKIDETLLNSKEYSMSGSIKYLDNEQEEPALEIFITKNY